MYIRSVHIENIRSIESFDMAFVEGQEAGWHVLIGENGSGKTTIARCLGMGLLPEIEAVSFSLSGIFRRSETSEVKGNGLIQVLGGGNQTDICDDFYVDWTITSDGMIWWSLPEVEIDGVKSRQKEKTIFACGYGPFRRLSGKSDSFFQGGQRANFATLFSEEEGLPQTQTWFKDLEIDSRSNPAKASELQFVISFINTSKLLPRGATLTNKIDSHGIKIIDAAGNEVYFRDASDGYRSILSLTLDLKKNIIAHYGIEKVMKYATDFQIPLPGVVIIDEVDAHLHPTWQVKIGQWFTKYFPQLQFIVTTHSPLICRACGDHGKIFKLAAPGSATPSGEITGVDRDRLVYGDILVAYETDAFGDGVEWGEESRMLQKEYRELVYKRRFGVAMTAEETARLERLTPIFRSHVEAD